MRGSPIKHAKRSTSGPWQSSRKEDLMEILDRYRRTLKRRNCSSHTVKNYMNIIGHFMQWLEIPINEVTRNEIGTYVDRLLRKHLKPKTITCHLQAIRL